jgi:hypothetical protein
VRRLLVPLDGIAAQAAESDASQSFVRFLTSGEQIGAGFSSRDVELLVSFFQRIAGQNLGSNMTPASPPSRQWNARSTASAQPEPQPEPIYGGGGQKSAEVTAEEEPSSLLSSILRLPPSNEAPKNSATTDEASASEVPEDPESPSSDHPVNGRG